MVGDKSDSNNVVYLVSDFRAKDWTTPTALEKLLQKLNSQGVQVQLVNCVDSMRPNLAITALKPAGGIRAAGVPLEMEVTVHNFGPTAVRNLSVRLEEQGIQRPAIEIDKIDAGRSVKRQFEVRAPNAGQRRITALLPPDAVMADNSRDAVVDFPVGVPVLIIDGGLKSGTARGGDGYFLQSVLAQPGPIPTGLRPRVEPPRFLEEHQLDEFQTVYLCNVDRFSQAAVEKLTKYVEAGGGLAFFLGDQSRADFLNRLYAEGNGLFPAPLEAPVPLLVEQSQKTPDLAITDHPIFRVFSGENNPFIKMVNIEKYFAVKKGWKPAEGSTTAVIARIRNGAPLAIEKKLGEGRIVAFLTTAAPQWNNWARDNPSFVVTLLELQSYLSAPREIDPARIVGTPWEVKVDPQKYLDQVEFTTPAEGTDEKVVVKAVPQNDGPSLARLDDTLAGGEYDAVLTQNDNTQDVLSVAYNVDPAESDLKIVSPEQLAAELTDVAYEYHRAADLYFDSGQLQGFNLSETVLYVLAALLIGEQLLAYSASYHPAQSWSELTCPG